MSLRTERFVCVCVFAGQRRPYIELKPTTLKPSAPVHLAPKTLGHAAGGSEHQNQTHSHATHRISPPPSTIHQSVCKTVYYSLLFCSRIRKKFSSRLNSPRVPSKSVHSPLILQTRACTTSALPPLDRTCTHIYTSTQHTEAPMSRN